MIIFDTNVISEILKPLPNEGVIAWIESLSRQMIFTTTVTKSELLYGAFILPEGKKKLEKLKDLRDILDNDFNGKILNFDNDAADAFAEISASRKLLGKPISQFDAMIAAIAKSRGARLATRNTRDFDECGIDIINPWSEGR